MADFLLYLVIILLLFLVGREIALWYFRINDIYGVLEEIRDILKEKNPTIAKKLEKKNDNQYLS
jgi:hypothetical protein